ncbi:sugar ABC transporter substrate-binding protein [Mesobacillus campisalis]|uniref:Sugar ABC transporter substrate-binding protein n=1 Tax=Mesobacillus campisalis TaxID=1408103 RepID=A0A0M2T0B9_9BACI|nr:extracellular solute-binding protein [Mesobacillus campisalis]KKK39406.1 sugar ABC transporter substrate-binding protein [Mesobacillus campisalis]
MKKVSLIIVSVFFLILSSACSSEGTANQTKSQGSGDQITLDLWHFDPGERMEIYAEAVKRFEEKHPNVKVNVLQVPNDEYKQRVVVAMAGGNAPDVFASWGGGWLHEFVKSDQVLDLTEQDIDFDKFIDVALANAKYDEKIYGLPLGISLYTFYYNKEIFEKNGLEVPKTYDEFLNVVDVLKETGIYPIAMANQPKWPGAFYLMYFADRLGGEQVFQNALNRTGEGFDSPYYVEAGKYIQDLVKREAFNPGFNGLPYDAGSARQLMYSDQAAMMLMTGGFVNNVRQEFPAFEEKMGVFQFPAIEGGKGDPTNISGGISPTWSIKKDTKHPELTVELLNELTSLETAQDYVNRSGNVVAIKGVEVKDPYVETFTQWVNEANAIQFPYDQTLPPELAEVHKNTTFDLFGLTTTPEKAAEEMEKKAKEVIK